MGDDPTSITTKAGRRALRSIVVKLNETSDEYTTYRGRPKAAADSHTWAEAEVQPEAAAVVMQGPPYEPDDFTIETLKLYARQMPKAQLILSTWNDTPEEILAPIRALGVDVVLSDKPSTPGIFNINMQLASARAGVRRAAEQGAEWILKTRTDQRLSHESFMSVLISMAKSFPVASGYKQRFRVIGVGQGSLKYAPYHITDQTIFGHAEDMLAYWDIPLKDDELPASWPKDLEEVYHQVPVGELCKLGAAESRLASGFLERVGRPLSWTLVDHWEALRDHFCFVEHSMVELYWVKAQTYTLGKEHARDLEHITNRKEIGFAEWMLLYSGQLPPEAAARYVNALGTTFVERIENAG